LSLSDMPRQSAVGAGGAILDAKLPTVSRP
jgi:hypothetical protein